MSASFLVLILILDGVAVVIVAVVIIYVVIKINGKTNLMHQIVFFFLHGYFHKTAKVLILFLIIISSLSRHMPTN